MKRVLLLTFTLFLICFWYSAFSQEDPGNNPYQNYSKDDRLCEREIALQGCGNHIPNPSFHNDVMDDSDEPGVPNGSTITFASKSVYFWEAAFGNPLLNNNIGSYVSVPPPPNVNYASLEVGMDENNEDVFQGIKAKTVQLQNGHAYALSFFRWMTDKEGSDVLPDGKVKFKIILLHCRDLRETSFESRNELAEYMTGVEHQIIYCENIKQDVSWKQAFIKFTAESDYDLILVYPELQEELDAPGIAAIHFAYPELIDVNNFTVGSIQQTDGCTVIIGPSTPNCGVWGAQFTWITPSGLLEAASNQQLQIQLTTSNQRYYLVMSVPNVVNDYQNNACGMNNVNVTAHLDILASNICKPEYGESVESYSCSGVVNTTSCNLIPNPKFTITNPSVLVSAFVYNNVIDWAGTHLSADINKFGNVMPTPWPVAPLNSTYNYAHMYSYNDADFSDGSTWSEGIAARIKQLQQGHKYLLSFYVSNYSESSLGSTNIINSLKVRLTNCQQFPQSPPQIPVPTFTNEQVVYCGNYTGTIGWRQIVVSFIANDSYDLIAIHPEMITGQGDIGNLHFANPELVDVSSFDVTIGALNTANCTRTLSGTNLCFPINAAYRWKKGNTIVGTGTSITVNASTDPGAYSLEVYFPNVANPSNACSENNPVLTKSVTVGDCSSTCGGLTITQAIWDAREQNILTSYANYDLLAQVNNSCTTYVCHHVDGYQNASLLSSIFSFRSNLATGNVWSIFRDGNPVPVTQNPGVYSDYYELGTNGSNCPANNSSQDLCGRLFFVNLTGPTTFEFRLNNGSLQKSIYVTVLPKPTVTWTLTNNNPGWQDFVHTNLLYTSSSTQYNWSFPSGLNYVWPSTTSPDFSFELNSVTGPLILSVTNSQYGCDAKYDVAPNYNRKSLNTATVTGTSIPLNTKTHIYPNPVKNNFIIVSDKTIATVDINTIDGRVLKRVSINTKSSNLNVEELKQGSYILTIVYQDKTKESKIFIKQ